MPALLVLIRKLRNESQIRVGCVSGDPLVQSVVHLRREVILPIARDAWKIFEMFENVLGYFECWHLAGESGTFSDKVSLLFEDAKLLADFVVDGSVLLHAVEAEVLRQLGQLGVRQGFAEEVGDFDDFSPQILLHVLVEDKVQVGVMPLGPSLEQVREVRPVEHCANQQSTSVKVSGSSERSIHYSYPP